MTTGIYKITNLVNGKVYIGASKNIESRWGEHRNYRTAIADDLKVFGLENFKFEVLLECPEDMLCQWERDMICLYDSDDPEKGYNDKSNRPYSLKNSESHKGKPAWNKGLRNIYSDETKRKISETLKGRPSKKKGKPGTPHSEETKRKMRGRIAWNKGISHSEETKRKISETLKRRFKEKEV